jgi:hypothetical protein
VSYDRPGALGHPSAKLLPKPLIKTEGRGECPSFVAVSKKELETELRIKDVEIAMLKDMLSQMREQRDHLTEVLVSVFGSKQATK